MYNTLINIPRRNYLQSRTVKMVLKSEFMIKMYG